MPTELKDEFPLSVLAPALAKFQPPAGAFEPEGEWTHRYGLYTVGQRSVGRIGSVTLRRVAARAGPVLHLQYRKPASGKFTNAIDAEIHCQRGARAAPVRWEVVFRTLDSDGRALAGTRIEKAGRVDGKAIELRDARTTRTLPAPDAFTVSWALFDAVQRLPREAFEPWRFTLLDNFDEPKPNHVLSYRKSLEVLTGGRRVQKREWQQLAKGRVRRTVWGREGDRPLRLHAYDHLGDGIVPEVYWVDGQGRLLIVAAGLEAYIWEGAA